MTNNLKICVSTHAKERALERFVPHISKELKKDEQMQLAEDIVKDIFRDAKYLSDNETGILFRNIDFRADLVVQNRTIITILKLRGKKNGKGFTSRKAS